jgi:hypothetical protein
MDRLVSVSCSCGGSWRTSGSASPTIFTSVAWSSWVCSLPGGQAFQIPEISTAVPVDSLVYRRNVSLQSLGLMV